MSKNETLGMPHGTASGRLRKSILFALLSGRLIPSTVCSKCSEQIESEDDLSIEHINPWENEENGKELFFDLNNITFSHLKCNVPQLLFGGDEGQKRATQIKKLKALRPRQLSFRTDEEREKDRKYYYQSRKPTRNHPAFKTAH